jgi:hypothetical protein
VAAAGIVAASMDATMPVPFKLKSTVFVPTTAL